VTTELAKLSLDLAAVWKWQRRIRVPQVIQAVDLEVEGGLVARREGFYELVDWL
jgi:hypothetical protein